MPLLLNVRYSVLEGEKFFVVEFIDLGGVECDECVQPPKGSLSEVDSLIEKKSEYG